MLPPHALSVKSTPKMADRDKYFFMNDICEICGATKCVKYHVKRPRQLAEKTKDALDSGQMRIILFCKRLENEIKLIFNSKVLK